MSLGVVLCYGWISSKTIAFDQAGQQINSVLMIERSTKKNLNGAYERVYRNKGSAGMDRVHITGLKSILRTHGRRYIRQIEREAYRVSPILSAEIPKSNGKKRLLGIPTVVDRVFQQALHQVLQPGFEPDFQKHG